MLVNTRAQQQGLRIRFSGVIYIISIGTSLKFWIPQDRDNEKKKKCHD